MTLLGKSIWRDWYRLFVRLFDGEVIWFYQSDVLSAELVPPYPIAEVGGDYSIVDRYVCLHINPNASRHPEGATC